MALYHHAWSQNIRVQLAAKWYQQNYILSGPSFSPDNNNIALVAQPSGAEASFTILCKTASRQFIAAKDTLKRSRDPLLLICSPSDGKYSIAGFGWSPSFSPKGKRLVYTHQQVPLENKRPDAVALKGNSIQVLDLITGRQEAVATPPRQFFLDPVFTDSLHIMYKSGDAVNGPFGAGISFLRLNLKTRVSETIQPARITYRFYDIMGEIYPMNNGYAYTVYSPADSGKGMASEYSHLLLKGRDTLQNFGIRPFNNLKYKFAATPQGILYLDDNHLMAEDTNFLVTYQKNKLVRKKPVPFNYAKSCLSPDGRFLLYITDALESYITGTDDLKPIKLELPAKAAHAVHWSNDGSRLLIIQDHPDLKDTDMLYLFTVKP